MFKGQEVNLWWYMMCVSRDYEECELFLCKKDGEHQAGRSVRKCIPSSFLGAWTFPIAYVLAAVSTRRNKKLHELSPLMSPPLATSHVSRGRGVLQRKWLLSHGKKKWQYDWLDLMAKIAKTGGLVRQRSRSMDGTMSLAAVKEVQYSKVWGDAKWMITSQWKASKGQHPTESLKHVSLIS